MTDARSAPPPPTVAPCMLFCDGVIVEHGTGKTTLVGTYSGLSAESFPSPPRDLHVYVQLTSYVGVVRVRLACIQADSAEADEVYATEHTLLFRGKLSLEQVHFVWNQFAFPRSGEYAFQLW